MAAGRRERRKKKTCRSSKRHATQSEAIGFLRGLQKSGRERRDLTVFRCRTCGKWHVGRVKPAPYASGE